MHRITIVGSPDAETLLGLEHGLALAPQQVTWTAAARIRDPGRAIVAFIGGSGSAALPALQVWTHRAWQPLTVVSVQGGTSAWREALEARGFGMIAGTGAPDRARLRRGLERVLTTDTWLIPLAANVLGCHDPTVVRCLDACVRLLPQRHTVTSWSRALGFQHRQFLHGIFAERSLPPPKSILDHLRLACVAHHGQVAGRHQHREDLALRFGYASGDYLGKAVKRCLGCSLGELVEVGPVLPLQSLGRMAGTIT